MTTHSNYSLQNFSTNNAKVLTENSQSVLDFKYLKQKCTESMIPTQDENRPSADFCPSWFINFCLLKILYTYHITEGVVNFPKTRTKRSKP